MNRMDPHKTRRIWTRGAARRDPRQTERPTRVTKGLATFIISIRDTVGGLGMPWVYECRTIQPSCSFRSESVGSRDDAKRLGIIHLKNVHRINVDRDWERMVEKAIR
jgi:hypothetical protein